MAAQRRVPIPQRMPHTGIAAAGAAWAGSAEAACPGTGTSGSAAGTAAAAAGAEEAFRGASAYESRESIQQGKTAEAGRQGNGNQQAGEDGTPEDEKGPLGDAVKGDSPEKGNDRDHHAALNAHGK